MLMCIGVQQGKERNGHLSSCRTLLLKETPKSTSLGQFSLAFPRCQLSRAQEEFQGMGCKA